MGQGLPPLHCSDQRFGQKVCLSQGEIQALPGHRVQGVCRIAHQQKSRAQLFSGQTTHQRPLTPLTYRSHRAKPPTKRLLELCAKPLIARVAKGLNPCRRRQTTPRCIAARDGRLISGVKRPKDRAA